MNPSVLKSLLTTALAALGAYAAGAGWLTNDQWTQLSPLLATLAIGIYKSFDHTDAAIEKKADAISPATTVKSSGLVGLVALCLVALPLLGGCGNNAATPATAQGVVNAVQKACSYQVPIDTAANATAAAVQLSPNTSAVILTAEQVAAIGCTFANAVAPAVVPTAPPVVPAAAAPASGG